LSGWVGKGGLSDGGTLKIGSGGKGGTKGSVSSPSIPKSISSLRDEGRSVGLMEGMEE